jgi:hypothetical protein
MPNFKTFIHSGDLGDAIYALHTIKMLGGGQVYLVTRPQTKAFTPERVSALKPLMLEQHYIVDVVDGEPPQQVDYDFSTFRKAGHPFGFNLVELQSRWVERQMNGEVPPASWNVSAPWLTAPDSEFNGRVVVHRSARYQNANFPWKQLAAHYGDKMIAVGFPEELEALERVAGRKIEYARTSDLLEMAKLIAGASLFIGNQSSPLALATGLGVPVIQETCIWTPDCVYPAMPVQYVFDGNCVTVPVDGVDEVLEIKRVFRPSVDRACVPPGAWQYPLPAEEGRNYKNNIFNNLLSEVLRDLRRSGDMVPREELAEKIEDFNAARLPNFWPSPGDCFRGIREFLRSKGVSVA